MDGVFNDLMHWSREDVLWRPTNSHSPFKEAVVGDLELTEEELLRCEEHRK